jgi:hypothetical protein
VEEVLNTSGGIRRSAIDRIPARRRAAAPSRDVPRWLRALLIIVPLLLLLGTLAGLAQELRMPPSLAQARLTGAPTVTGPICIEEAVDVSGSLAAYASQRDEAETEMFRFARRQLPRNDLFAEAFFAATGKLALAPAPLSSLSVPPAQPRGISPDATYLTPAVDDLIAARSASPVEGQCAARALIVITDGLIEDPGPLAAALRQGHYTRVFAVIPAATGLGRPGPLSGGALTGITVYHFTTSTGLTARIAGLLDGARPLDVVFGTIISSLTGQHLVRA